MASTPRSLPPRRSTTPAKQDESAGTTAEPRQQQPQATTTRTTTTTATTTTRHRITVDIPQRPRYVPGRGPPLQAVSLVPPADSTAYVVDRILLPPTAFAADGHPRPRRMTYLLGWTDLPAARLLVPALRVLDYVSPRALEAYESELEMELEADMAKLEEERKVEESLQLQQQNQRQEDAIGDGTRKKKKKRGRPPKHTQIEAAAVADLEAGDYKASWLTGGAMALSTPRKDRTRRDFEGLSDDDDDDDDDDEGSPSRQLARGEAQGLSREGSSEHQRGGGDLGTSWRGGGGGGSYDESGPGGDNAHPSSSLWGLPGGDSLSLFAAGESLAPPTKSNKRKTPPQSSSAEGDGADGAAAFSPTSKPKKSAKSAKPKPRPELEPEPEPEAAAAEPEAAMDGEEVWVVKRILDCDVYEAEGRGRVRYFRVLWEGEWPPDQNPSWEPEENLPRQLVRNYFKTSKARRLRMRQRHAGVKVAPSLSPKKKKKKKKKEVKAAPLSKQQSKLKQSKPSWGAAAATAGPRYSSVSEAFTGSPGDVDEDEDDGYGYGEGELMMDRFEFGTRGGSNGARAGVEDSSPEANDEDDDDGDGKELFVVDGGAEVTKTPSGVGWFAGGAGNQLFGSRVFI
ncbi:hypothetical protein N3K66_000298 [Trichothecium roseum]|uniref:Uncharacterized protein n=1 Tax=Trichothecium roseum TaxID=47278 RepID=A0ACC0VBU2_9HYPO|nr:hypothetical protein N3K66_000298 [Trichothecium roseum]